MLDATDNAIATYQDWIDLFFEFHGRDRKSEMELMEWFLKEFKAFDGEHPRGYVLGYILNGPSTAGTHFKRHLKSVIAARQAVDECLQKKFEKVLYITVLAIIIALKVRT